MRRLPLPFAAWQRSGQDVLMCFCNGLIYSVLNTLLQYHTFCAVKGNLLRADMYGLALQNVTFRFPKPSLGSVLCLFLAFAP